MYRKLIREGIGMRTGIDIFHFLNKVKQKSKTNNNLSVSFAFQEIFAALFCCSRHKIQVWLRGG